MRYTTLLILAILLIGCGPATPDSPPVEQQINSAIPFEIPADTALLLRMNLPEVDRGASQLARFAPADDPLPIPSYGAGKFALGVMMGGPDSSRSLNAMEDYTGDPFPGLDTTRPVLGAMSTTGNEELLRRLRSASPNLDIGSAPRGLFVRFYLPASDPERLGDWVKVNCDVIPCGVTRRITRSADAVIVDYRWGNTHTYFSARSLPNELPEPPADTSFVEQRTAALYAFTRNDSAFGIYTRSERLPDVLAVHGATKALEAVDLAPPELRASLFQQGLRLAAGILRTESPDHRENYDSALLVEVGESLGAQIHWVTTHTEHGAKIAKAGTKSVDLATVETGTSIIEGHLAYDIGAAQEVAGTPGWMVPGGMYTLDRLTAFMREVGPLKLAYSAIHNYGIGFWNGMNAVMAVERRHRIDTEMTSDLDGLRLRFDVDAESGAPETWKPRGALIARFGSDDEAAQWRSALRERLDLLPFDVELETHGASLHASTGPDVTVGSGESAAPIWSLRIDLRRAMKLFAVIGPIPPNLEETLDGLSPIDLRARPIDGGLHVVATLGSTKGELDLAVGAKPVAQAVGFGACSMSARDSTRRALDDLHVGALTIEGARRLVGELAPLECAEARAMRADWMEWIGRTHAQRLAWKPASEALQMACELRGQSPCEAVEKVQERKASTRLAKVGRTVVPLNESAPLLLTASQLSSDPFTVEVGSRAMSPVDTESIGKGTFLPAMLAQRLEAGGAFAARVEPDVSAFVVAKIAHAIDTDRSLGDRRQPFTTTVATEDGYGAFRFEGLRRTDVPALTLRFTEAGVDVLQPASVEPLEGCDADGPTVCTGEDLATRVGNVIASRLEEGDLVELRVGNGVTFATLAQVAAEVRHRTPGNAPRLALLPMPSTSNSGAVATGFRVAPMEPATFAGAIDPSVVARQMQDNAGKIASCYERTLRTNPDVTGEVRLILEVERQRVKISRISSNTANHPELAECLRSEVNRWRFRGEREASTVEVGWSFYP